MDEKMKLGITRKNFLKKTSLAMAGAGLGLHGCRTDGAGAGDDQVVDRNKTYRWNMVTTWPPNFPVLFEGCELFAKWVEDMSAGQLKIRVYGGGELIPALEAFDAVSSRTAEIGSGAAYYWAGKSPATQFFASVPFGLNAQQMNAWLYSGGGMELWEEVYAPFNVIPLASGNTGLQMGGWFNREINSMEDIQGLKMRMPGLGGKVLERAGGTAVLSAGSEIYTNLERGVIDATEWLGPYHDYLMGFHEIAKYYYYPGWHEPGTVLELFINKFVFEQLPAHLQAIVRSAAAHLNVWMLSEFEAKNAQYLKKMQEETDVEIRRFPIEVLNRFKEIASEVNEELVSDDPLIKRIYTSLVDFKRSISNWSEITERQFYEVL